MGEEDKELFDEEILEQDDYYEDDGFSEIEESPNREEVNEIKESTLPGVVTKVLKWIVDKIFAIVIILIVFAFFFLGYKILMHMTRADADIGGVSQAVEMLDW